MAMSYNPRAPELYNQVRGMPQAGGRPNAYGAPRRAIPGPTSVMPLGGPRMGEVNAGAPGQGNPLMGNFPVEPSRYGNSMGQPVMGMGPQVPNRSDPRMPSPVPRPTPPPARPPVGTGAAPVPQGPPPTPAEHSPRFMQMLQNTAKMNDTERATYINSQRDALMERLSRYDFAKNRGLQLDESAQADYDNIAKMMQEINRYNQKLGEMQQGIENREWEQRQPFGPMISGMPVAARYDPNVAHDWEIWNMNRPRDARQELEQSEQQRMMDELARYRTGGYGL